VERMVLVPSREIFDALFCMLFETEDWASDDNDRVYIIKNQGFLHFLAETLHFRCVEPDVSVAPPLPNRPSTWFQALHVENMTLDTHCVNA